MEAIESYSQYRLFVQLDSILDNKKIWSPIGCPERSQEEAAKWLRANFDVWQKYPNAKYRIVKTIYWRPTEIVVGEATRP